MEQDHILTQDREPIRILGRPASTSGRTRWYDRGALGVPVPLPHYGPSGRLISYNKAAPPHQPALFVHTLFTSQRSPSATPALVLSQFLEHLRT
jgi:hypothetical protein